MHQEVQGSDYVLKHKMAMCLENSACQVSIFLFEMKGNRFKSFPLIDTIIEAIQLHFYFSSLARVVVEIQLREEIRNEL